MSIGQRSENGRRGLGLNENSSPPGQLRRARVEHGPAVEWDQAKPARPEGQLYLLCLFDVLPPALLHIVLAGARTRFGRLGVPIALEKEAEAVVAPVVAARNGDIDRRPAHDEAALGLVSRNGDIDRRPAHQEAALGL